MQVSQSMSNVGNGSVKTHVLVVLTLSPANQAPLVLPVGLKRVRREKHRCDDLFADTRAL